MDPSWMAKQIIDFQKSAFDHSFQTTALLQEHMEKMTSTTIRDIGWLPEAGKRMVEEWAGNCKKGRTELKRILDGQFQACSVALAPKGSAKAEKS